MTIEQPLLFQLNDRVGTITFNRPKELNAINLDMARAMGELARKLPGVGDMKAIMLRGSVHQYEPIILHIPSERFDDVEELPDFDECRYCV